MAFGIHWEWRGFGTVSYEFVHRFCELAELIPPVRAEDVYIWIPGLGVNCKYRESEVESGLKFKRPIKKDGTLEQWNEDEGEVFDFPLSESGWKSLAGMLAGVNLDLGPYPDTRPDRDSTIAGMKTLGCRTIAVIKTRASKLWRGPENRPVKVEWASISKPQLITSIGLETWEENGGDGIPDDRAKGDLLEAIRDLGLDREPLAVMNYLEAVKIWASGKVISGFDLQL